MFSVATLSSVVLGYLILMFLVGLLGNKYVRSNQQHPIIYSLALGVHCTSWAFFGTTTQAAQYGWAFIPTYLGVILVMIFGFKTLIKISQICLRYNVSSLADFIGLQYQRSHLLSAIISILCFFGVVPYIALQLDSLSRGVNLLSNSPSVSSSDIGLYVTVVLALFAVLFGARSFSLTEKNPGLMFTIAFASIIKLIALLSVGLFVCYYLFDGVFDLLGQAQNNDRSRQIIYAEPAIGVYLTHVLLGICAMFCLPRQFHTTFIENNGEQELRAARWLFPLYLVGMTIFVLPIALGGHILLDPQDSSTDTYALALPLMVNDQLMALISFIGGLAAATSMVMVATLAVGIMVSNNLVTPLWLKFKLSYLNLDEQQGTLQPKMILFIRRLTIVLVLAIAFLYHINVSNQTPLVNSGTIAMALLAQTMPILLLSLYWRKGHKYAAMGALLTGALGWFYWLLWPSVKASYYFDPPPTDLSLGLGFVFSISANLVCFIILANLFPGRLRNDDNTPAPFRFSHQGNAIKITRLMALCKNMLSDEKLRVIRRFAGDEASESFASPKLLDTVEHEMAGQIGGASARILMSAIAEKEQTPLPELMEWMEEASQTFQFNHEMLQSSVQHIQQGISVVDRDLNLIAWNQSYVDLFRYPQDFIEAGLSMRQLLEFNAKRGLLGDPKNAEEEINKRINFIRQGSQYKYVRTQPGGNVIELNGSPLPGGGFVTTYSDITEYITIQQELELAKVNLEQRVEDRTQQLKLTNDALTTAKQEAEDANESKTKFLAAAGHDLMQPFNAASLFAELIAQKANDGDILTLSHSLIESLNNAEELLSLLLDMTKLESGALSPNIQKFPLKEVLDPLAKEFTLLAEQKGLKLHYVGTKAVVNSDKKLLRRVLQNLLSNAVRYTHEGKVLFGCKRQKEYVNIIVADTGEGISEGNQTHIFKEFHQINEHSSQQGLGLGLTIVDKITQLISHPLQVESTEGKGSCFAVQVPVTDFVSTQIEKDKEAPVEAAKEKSLLLHDKRILLAENESKTRDAVSQLLVSWGASVVLANTLEQAEKVNQKVDLMLLDFHLDREQKGTQIAKIIRTNFGEHIPGILNTASREEEVRTIAADTNLYYLPKPLKVAAFKRLVRKIFATP